MNDNTVVGVCADTGYPVNQFKNLLDPFGGEVFTPWDIGTELEHLTDPYKSLEFVIGSGDDFVCFDYATISGPRGKWIVLDATRNSETAHDISSADYQVLPINTDDERRAAVRAAINMADLGYEGVRHTRKGWNQDTSYFARAVFCRLFRFKVQCASRGAFGSDAWVTDHMKRFGGNKLDVLIDTVVYGRGPV